MKEQDAAHSFEKEEDDIRGYHEPDDRPQSMKDLAEKLKLEKQIELDQLTRLRSELQTLKSALAHCKQVGEVRQEIIVEQKSELQKERELRKELVNCLEVHQTKWISADHYWGSDTNEWAETLIEKAKLNN